MLQIDGRWECVAEYLDRYIGQQKVVDVVQRGKTVYYVFETDHELPMLCWCCGESLVVKDLESMRREMRGRRLESMSFGPVTLEDGSELPQFVLEFSKKGWESHGLAEPVSPEVAVKLRHPDRRLSRQSSPPMSNEFRRQRRRRKR
jgi:hypothetical protein